MEEEFFDAHMEQLEDSRRLEEQRRIIQEAMARSRSLLEEAKSKKKQREDWKEFERRSQAKRMCYSTQSPMQSGYEFADQYMTEVTHLNAAYSATSIKPGPHLCE